MGPRSPQFCEPARPRVFAHRGDSTSAPENTLPAFLGAVELGVDVVETDIHWTKDGVIVVSHDANVERVSNGHGRIEDLKYAELLKFDFGYRFSLDEGKTFPFRGNGIRILRFSEMLRAFPKMHFNVDLKPKQPGSIRELIREIYGEQAEQRVMIASFHDGVLRQFRAANTSIATSASPVEILMLLASVRFRLRTSAAVPYRAVQVPNQMYGIRVITRSFVEEVHQRGAQVHVWTIDDPVEMKRLWSLGVDAIMTNNPFLGTVARQEWLKK